MQQVAMIRKALEMTKKAHAGQARLGVQGVDELNFWRALGAFAPLKRFAITWLDALWPLNARFVLLHLPFTCLSFLVWHAEILSRCANPATPTGRIRFL